jgi:hypothetical protein
MKHCLQSSSHTWMSLETSHKTSKQLGVTEFRTEHSRILVWLLSTKENNSKLTGKGQF